MLPSKQGCIQQCRKDRTSSCVVASEAGAYGAELSLKKDSTPTQRSRGLSK